MNGIHMQTFKIGLNCLQQYNRNMKHYVASKACTMKKRNAIQIAECTFFHISNSHNCVNKLG